MQIEIEITHPKTGEISKLIEVPGSPPQVTILHRGQSLGPYTPDEVDLFLDLLLAYRRRRNPAFDTLLRAVAEHHHIPVTHLLDHSRGNHVVTAREAAMAMCSEFFQQDSKAIAAAFNCHDSLVRLARRKILKRQQTPEGRADLAALRLRVHTALAVEHFSGALG